METWRGSSVWSDVTYDLRSWSCPRFAHNLPTIAPISTNLTASQTAESGGSPRQCRVWGGFESHWGHCPDIRPAPARLFAPNDCYAVSGGKGPPSVVRLLFRFGR
ncbi:hypothetical protein ACFFX0_26010 [Citricoccus parietis]|uniref:Uncharacterized protein n=1 Tax=Citricoccus parietis TaxID=592307 RepID=A0ABV5G693_9MICC